MPVLACVLGLMMAGAPAPVSISLPGVAPEKTSVTVRVDVPRDTRNRRLALVWDGPVGGLADRPMDGNSPSRILFAKELRTLPRGIYTVQAILIREERGEFKEIRSTPHTLYVGVGPDDIDAPQ